MAREVRRRYVDPLAQIWLGAARRIGLGVVRAADVYAATDGRGTLAIGLDDALDPDDSLGQMIFHELCHSLIEGKDAFARPDWGMDNTGPDHDWREHACLRLQWVLAGRHGLRAVLAPTTEFRAFWDRLAGDPLADRGDPAVRAAIAGLTRADEPPWAPALEQALAATAALAAAAAPFAAAAPPPPPGAPALPSLWADAEPAPPPHPSGLPARAADGATCAQCAWKLAARCRQAGRNVDPAWPACERYEPALDCQTCGACCREAYQSVEVGPRERVRRTHPALVVDRGSYLELARAGERCAALAGGALEGGAYTRYQCVIYPDRPRTCREFTLGSEHCLTARRRVGLSL